MGVLVLLWSTTPVFNCVLKGFVSTLFVSFGR